MNSLKINQEAIQEKINEVGAFLQKAEPEKQEQHPRHSYRAYYNQPGNAYKMRDGATYKVASDGALVRTNVGTKLSKKERNKLRKQSA